MEQVTTGQAPSKQTDESFCSSCGAVIKSQAEICPKCGVRQKTAALELKNAGIAAIISVFVPGGGQIYNGQIGKGIAFMVIAFILALSMMVFIGLILYPLFWAFNIYDAYNVAQKVNNGTIKLG